MRSTNSGHRRLDGGAIRLWQVGAPAEVVICAAKARPRSKWPGPEWHIGPGSVGLVYRSLGVRLELCGSFRLCDGGDCPLALVQIDRLSKSSLSRTATAERAQYVREPEAGIGLERQ
jgi:hypothetical protein